MIDQVDQFQVSRKQITNQVSRPLFKRLWKNGMVGVGERVVDNTPSLFEREHLFIDENAQELDRGDGWVSIVQLDAILVGEKSESIVVLLLISAHHVVDGGGREEVLLLETELLTAVSAIVRI
jgi:hypothetical protein